MSRLDLERVVTINAQKDRIAQLEADKRNLLQALRQARRDLIEFADSERNLAPSVEQIDRAIAGAEAGDSKPPRKSRKQPTVVPEG